MAEDLLIGSRWVRYGHDRLAHRGTVLSSEQVEALFEVARRSTTWAG
ncbi:hypothetical protein [Jatrophihabitans sp.]|nr:hypothetical protein [Jatrophihabitans sp.]